jgi:hypothetical protein
VSFRQRLRRLKERAEDGAVSVRQRDGSLRYFEEMHVRAEMFLASCELWRDTARESDVLDAVRGAAPESRAAFEERFGPIRMVNYVVGSGSGGWVEMKLLTEDGEVLRAMYDAASSESALVREGVRAGTESETPRELPLPPVAGRWVDEPAEDLSE